MCESFEVRASSGSYSVSIEPGSFEAFLSRTSQDVVLADCLFHDACSQTNAIAVVPCVAREESKSLENVPAVVEQLRLAGAHRKTRLIAVGGGTVQDLCAFVASIYMRGMEWIYMPTTVLAMVDSCIGGKSSINVGGCKNLVGTFHPPSRVWIDPLLIRSLAYDQQAGGLIEAAKICFCRGADCFRAYLARDPRPGMETTQLAGLISQSLRAKKWFIETDEFDQRERLLLNFGHTFGHAIEGATDYGIAHGIAVGLGMLCALAFSRSWFHDSLNAGCEMQAPEIQMLEEHVTFLLRYREDLADRVVTIDVDAVLERFRSDKKHRSEYYVLILVAPTGKVGMETIEHSAQTDMRVRAAMIAALATFRGVSNPPAKCSEKRAVNEEVQ